MVEQKKVPSIRFKGFADDWEQRKLGDIIDKLTGGASIAPDDYVEEGYRTIPKGAVNDTGVADMSGCKCVSEAFYKKNISSKTSTGELVTSLRDLVPTAPNMGRIVRIYGDTEDFLMPQGVYSIVLKKDTDEDFLIAYSNSPEYRKIITTEKNGSTQVHIRNGEFLSIDNPVPSYEEQKKIGATIKNLDNLITLQQRKYDKLVNVKKAMLEKMFPKEGETVPKIRFKGFTDDWEPCKLKDFGKATGGTSIESEFSEDGIFKVISIGSYSEDSTYRDQGIRAIKSEKTMSRVLKKDDITMILNDKTASGNIIGRVLLIDESDVYVYNQRTEKIEIDKEHYDPLFLYEMLNAPKIRDKIIKQSQGNTQIYVNWTTISLTEYMIPTIMEQRKIGKHFFNLDNLITFHQHKIEKLKNIKKAMLENMFV